MSKSDMIDAIRKLNPTARTDFLAEFSPHDLDDYLRKLQTVRGGREARQSADSGKLAAAV